MCPAPSFIRAGEGESQLRDGLRGEAGGRYKRKRVVAVNPEVSWCKAWRHDSPLQKLTTNLEEIEPVYEISHDSYPK